MIAPWSVRGAVVTLAAALVLPTIAVPSVAVGGDDGRGPCSRHAQWRLEADPDGGRIEVQGEVRNGPADRRWNWRLLHDGAVSARGQARADGGGSFDVERSMVNASGPDRIGWRAHNPRSGETCRGSIRY